MSNSNNEIIFDINDNAWWALDRMLDNNKTAAVVTDLKGNVAGVIRGRDIVKKIRKTEVVINDCTLGELITDLPTIKYADYCRYDNCMFYFWERFMPDDFPLALLDKDGSVKQIISSDDAIQECRRGERYYRSILDCLDDGILTVNSDNIIVFLNRTFEQIHRIKRTSVIGENLIEIFPESLMADGQIVKESHVKKPLRITSTGASTVPKYQPLKDTDENIIGSLAIVKDYAKMQNLYIGGDSKSSDLLYHSIFNNLMESVAFVNKKFKIVYTNKAFELEFGLSKGDFLVNCELKRMLREKFAREKIDAFNIKVHFDDISDGKTFNLVGIPLLDINSSVEGIILILQDVTHVQKLKAEVMRKSQIVDFYKKHLNDQIPADMICESSKYKEAVSTAIKVAPTDATVLIQGENGAGKEVVAQLIHQNSNRADKPFIPINCGAIPESLWESEMFGYESGAFTGSQKGGKAGLLEVADQGTVFLDEVGEMPLQMQVKILRFLQNKEILKVGSQKTKIVDVRIISATNRKLEEMVNEGRFREDLFYRLNVVTLEVPPLRERRSDIPFLAKKFISDYNKKYNKNVTISKEAMDTLIMERWKGNIRQLKNVIEQSVIMCEDEISTEDLPVSIRHTIPSKTDTTGSIPTDSLNMQEQVKKLETQLILEALKQSNYNKTKAIDLLGISRKTFYKKLEDYDI